MDTQIHEKRDDGFSLIELLVVVAIIAILLAIAIPTFLGTRKSAHDRAAQTLVRNLLVSARTADMDGSASVARIQADEPTLRVVAGNIEGSASSSEVSVRVGQLAGNPYVILASRSSSGRCFAALEPQSAKTQYQEVESGTCTADSFDPSVGWSDQWP